MPRRFLPSLETLEEPTAPATFGVAWPDPLHLTLSFVPDGPNVVAGEPSTLFQTLDAEFAAQAGRGSPTPLWETTILRTFQTWASYANINIGVVADSGQPLGTSGPPQGDPNFGDIRIATAPLAPDVVAVSMPFEYTAGTWSGDVELNPSYFYPGTPYDLFTVAMHEAGHVFGFADNVDDPASVMFDTYTGPRTGLAPEDIAAIQGLYGVRQPDAYDAAASNDTLATATVLTPGNTTVSSGTMTVQGDLTTATDVDWYQITPANPATQVAITLHTAGSSLTVPQLSVFDAQGNLIESVVRAGPLGDDSTITLDLAALPASSSYYLEVSSGCSDGFGIGGYQVLIVGATSSQQSSGNQNGGTNANNGSNLQPKFVQSDARFSLSTTATLATATTVDQYTIKVPKTTDGLPTVMTVSVWDLPGSTLVPVVSVFDKQGNPVAAQVLVNENGTSTVQIDGVQGNPHFLIAVQAQDSTNAQASTGGYFLAVNFGTIPEQLTTLVAGQTVNAAAPTSEGTLTVNLSQLFHLILSAVPAGRGTGGTGQLAIIDSAGNVVFTRAIQAGQTQTATFLLLPGSYTFQFTADDPVQAPLAYSLKIEELTDKIGPQASDATFVPAISSGTSGAGTWQSGFTSFLLLLPTSADTEAASLVDGGGTNGTVAGLSTTSAAISQVLTSFVSRAVTLTAPAPSNDSGTSALAAAATAVGDFFAHVSAPALPSNASTDVTAFAVLRAVLAQVFGPVSNGSRAGPVSVTMDQGPASQGAARSARFDGDTGGSDGCFDGWIEEWRQLVDNWSRNLVPLSFLLDGAVIDSPSLDLGGFLQRLEVPPNTPADAANPLRSANQPAVLSMQPLSVPPGSLWGYSALLALGALSLLYLGGARERRSGGFPEP